MHDKLYKSIIIIVIVNVGGYFMNIAMIETAMTLAHWPFKLLLFEFGKILMNLAVASNALILYRTR